MSEWNDQVPFAGAEFAENPEPRCPCLLLLDTSASMAGSSIAELNAGLAAFKDELMADSMAVKRVEVGIVSFGPVQTVMDSRLRIRFNLRLLRRREIHRWGARSSTG